ncbi:MAG TPA: rhomboid family intramembrane serine protease [Sulfurospirillum sp. UBA12182]|nr:MAG TPA: rhomboid family intramembrane serine protease [Sulfurospirillum sp. UBA12182]
MNVTKTLILVNIICYFLQNSFDRSDLFFALNRYFLEAGLFWQPLTSMFMHGSLTHLAMNMVVLYQFGGMLEYQKGSRYLFLLYLGGGILTSIFSFVFMYFFGLNHVLVGASGAISVLFGWIAYVDRFNRKGIFVAILLISFAPLLLGVNIAWYAHIIGFGVGFCIAFVNKR